MKNSINTINQAKMNKSTILCAIALVIIGFAQCQASESSSEGLSALERFNPTRGTYQCRRGCERIARTRYYVCMQCRRRRGDVEDSNLKSKIIQV